MGSLSVNVRQMNAADAVNQCYALENTCLTLTDKQEVEVSASRQFNPDLGRISSRRHPVEAPSAASTPQKRSLRKTASALSPRKNTGKKCCSFGLPSRFLYATQSGSVYCRTVNWLWLFEMHLK